MKPEKEFEDFLSFIRNEYNDLDNEFLKKESLHRKVDNNDGLIVYLGKKITDFYNLDIDQNNKEKKDEGRIVKTNYFDKLRYKILGEKGQRKLLKKLNKKYLQGKEKDLENLVNYENIPKILFNTQKIDYKVNELSKDLENVNETINDLYDFIESSENINKNSRSGKSEGNESGDGGNKRGGGHRRRNHKNKEPSRIIIGINRPYDQYTKQEWDNWTEEIIHFLGKNFGDIKNTVLNYSPMIGIECESSDKNKIKNIIEKSNLKSLGNYNFKKYSFVEFDSIVGLPEIIQLENKRRIKTLSWNLKNIGIGKAHEYTKGMGAKIGIIDTGIDYLHKELSHVFDDSNLGYNFIDDNFNPMDYNSHGTHVAGIVAGLNIGVAPESELFALKVLDENGSGSNYDVIRAIEWGIKKELDVLNLSLGSNHYSQAMQNMCLAAHNRGISVVAAAGNDADTIYNYPAAYEGVVGVAAVDINNKRAYFSNANDKNDISAPGVEIYSSVPGDAFNTYSGTSMATPHVSGVIGLAKSIDQSSAESIEELMKDTAIELGDELEYGKGLIQAHKILEEL